LLQVNGGSPNLENFTTGPMSSESLAMLFSLGAEDDDFDLVDNLEFDGNWPSPMLPIGEDGCSNLCVLQLTGNRRGSVMFWDHEYGADDETDWQCALKTVAPDFRSFLKALSDTEDESVTATRQRFHRLVESCDWEAAVSLVVEVLPEYEVQQYLDYVLRSAIGEDDLRGVELLLPRVKAPLYALSSAVSDGRIAVVDYILSNGDSSLVNQPMWPFQFTLLHETVATDSVEMARVLLKHGADINARSASNLTPLRRAQLAGTPEMARFLERHGGQV
jgi:hypothetical protein